MCRSDDALYRATVLPGVLKADQRSHDEKCVNWNEAAIRELLTIRAEAEIVLQFSEMVRGALYTSHERSRVFTGCVWTHAQILENHRQCEWTKIKRSRDDSRNTLPVYFPESLCDEPLSHSHSGKYMENVSRDLSRDGLILVHSHCLWFSRICACVHTQPVKTRDLSCDVYNAPRTISLKWRTISASARIVRSSLIAASFQFTHFSSCERWSAFKTPGKTVER